MNAHTFSSWTSRQRKLNVTPRLLVRVLAVVFGGIGAASVLVSTALDREGSEDLSSLRLRPNEGCVLELGARSP